MLKTFVISNAVGAITALLGWTSAIMLMTSMSDETFESLRFGWAGLMAGSVALFAIFMLFAVHDIIEPMIMVISAGAVTALMWSQREIPLGENAGFTADTPEYYWATFTILTVILVLLMLGLRAARVSNQRARG